MDFVHTIIGSCKREEKPWSYEIELKHMPLLHINGNHKHFWKYLPYTHQSLHIWNKLLNTPMPEEFLPWTLETLNS